MITSEQALSCEFQKAGMNGYRASEVDEFISSVAETLSFQERKIRDMQRIIDELKKNETIIQTTLVNAQKLAMQITDEAKQTAEQKLAESQATAQAVTADADAKAEAVLADAIAKSKQLTADAEAAFEKANAEAEAKANQMLEEVRRIAAEESAKLQAEIEAQRALYDALKAEVSSFRADVLERYKAQVALIKDLPDLMPTVEVAPVQQEIVYEAPAKEVAPVEEPVVVEEEDDLPVAQISFVDNTPAEEPAEASSPLLKLFDDMQENEAQAAAAVEEVASLTENAQPAKSGFTVIFDDDDDEDDTFGGRIQIGEDNN
ncbi:MAG: DivIVA domain-containing protein [Clostridia bacterium]|nr:DivIVA domain-containing protein [Clostridia bacterium]